MENIYFMNSKVNNVTHAVVQQPVTMWEKKSVSQPQLFHYF